MCMAAQWSRPITHSHRRVVNISWVRCCDAQSAVFCYTFSSCTVKGCLYFSLFFFNYFVFPNLVEVFVELRSEIVFWCRTVRLAWEGIPTERVFLFFFLLPSFLLRKIHQIMLVTVSIHWKVSLFSFFFFSHTLCLFMTEKKHRLAICLFRKP